MIRIIFPLIFCAGTALAFAGSSNYQSDVLETSKGSLKMIFIGHASLMIQFDGKVIHVDPFSRVSDYSDLPPADLILITHEHGDHLDPAAIQKISRSDTKIVLSQDAYEKLGKGVALKNGEVDTVLGIRIEAVPAYNIVHKRDTGEPFHPKGRGNGYILTLGDKRVYIAGDTENTPEMKALKNIDIAFLPMNVPYTMTPEMVADAAKGFRPKVSYPYHYGDTDLQKLVQLLKDEKDIEVRVRELR